MAAPEPEMLESSVILNRLPTADIRRVVASSISASRVLLPLRCLSARTDVTGYYHYLYGAGLRVCRAPARDAGDTHVDAYRFIVSQSAAGPTTLRRAGASFVWLIRFCFVYGMVRHPDLSSHKQDTESGI